MQPFLECVTLTITHSSRTSKESLKTMLSNDLNLSIREVMVQKRLQVFSLGTVPAFHFTE